MLSDLVPRLRAMRERSGPVLAVLACTLLHAAPATAASQATVGMPFSGKWAYNINVNPPYTDANSSHPSVHWNHYGDWGTDLYAAAGTPVRLHVSAPGTVSFSWLSFPNGNCGERTVIAVDVDGVRLGSVYFEHLAGAVKSGPAPTNGMVVGYVANFGCNGGPHIHFELKNTSNHACWTDHGNPGTILAEGTSLGLLGSANNAVRQACSEVPPPQPDQDGDGTPDIEDRCPSLVGRARNHGCPADDDIAAGLHVDFDGDGLRDIGLVTPRGATGLNIVPLLSNGSSFAHGGLWAHTGSDYTIDGVKLFAGDFNRDGLSDVGLVTPRGATGLNIVPLLSNGSGFTHGGVWAHTGSDYTIDGVKLFAGDFNRDGYGDIGLVTPRGGTGLNIVPLLSTGTSFTNAGVWAETGTNYTVDEIKLIAGDFNRDGFSDIGLVTPRGAAGLNVVPLLSNGSSFAHGGLWADSGSDYTIDGVKLFAGDFNRDGFSDVGLVTPRGVTGLNVVPLLSNGSSFANGGVWAHTGTDYAIDGMKLFAGDFNRDGLSDVGLVTPRGVTGLNLVPLLSNGSSFANGGLWAHTGTDYTIDEVRLVGSFGDLPDPSSASAPEIAGTPQEGETLSAGLGSWLGGPVGFDHQWKRCDALGGSCAVIPGSTGSTYLLTAADVGSTLRVLVRAVTATSSASAESAATSVVSRPPAATGGPSAIAPPAPAPAGQDEGTPSPATSPTHRCRVPNLRGLSLEQARRRLRSRHCRLGKVRRTRGVRGGLVRSQSRRPGTRLRNGARVHVRVGRR